MTDFAAARRMMVDGQVRTSDVTDLRLIAAMLEIPRERYVPPAMAALAYLDLDLPLGEGASGRRLLKPMVLAKLIQAADVGKNDCVLDVACGTGYSTAVLAQLAASVVALEADTMLLRHASEALHAIRTVTVATGELSAGWPAAAPYDVIVLNGATEIEPQSLIQQLKDNGRLVCILGGGPASKAVLYRRSGEEAGSRQIFDAAAQVLPGFVKPPAFAF